MSLRHNRIIVGSIRLLQAEAVSAKVLRFIIPLLLFKSANSARPSVPIDLPSYQFLCNGSVPSKLVEMNIWCWGLPTSEYAKWRAAALNEQSSQG
ncbi:hypothetical protein MMC20_000333 [Loxospora ochrophaea]|nr:hypothetical protein [Loxospora ochrophaea]